MVQGVELAELLGCAHCRWAVVGFGNAALVSHPR